MEYLIRMFLCSSLFIIIYLGFLQNEKMYRFNRFYLLFSVFVSLLIPLLTFNKDIIVIEPVANMVSSGSVMLSNTLINIDNQPSGYFSMEILLKSVYGLIVFVLLIRLLFSNGIFFNRAKQSKKVYQNNTILALITKDLPPHSYFNTIFISRNDYEHGLIDSQVIDHEKAHIDQKHSYDVLLIEFLLVIFWFNPVLYIYRNAIRLNHEFLADEVVINQHNNFSQYSQLILNETAQLSGLEMTGSLSSSFNYLKTKKRLEMMTKNKFTRRILMKQCSLIPILFGAIIIFSNNSFAQEVQNTFADAKKEFTQQALQTEEKEEELQSTFDKLIEPYVKTNENGNIGIHHPGTQFEMQRMASVYLKMSEAQQAKQKVHIAKVPKLKKRVPTKEEFEKWKNEKEYGVWLDEKRINNSELNKYTNTDFSEYSISILAKNAKNYGKHVYQLDVRTNANFEAYNAKIEADQPYMFWPKWRMK